MEVGSKQGFGAGFAHEAAVDRKREIRRAAAKPHEPGVAAGKKMDLDLSAGAAVAAQVHLKTDKLPCRLVAPTDAKPPGGPGIPAVGGN